MFLYEISPLSALASSMEESALASVPLAVSASWRGTSSSIWAMMRPMVWHAVRYGPNLSITSGGTFDMLTAVGTTDPERPCATNVAI